jgi:hypothetical protein
MSPVLRLSLIYFTGARLNGWLTISSAGLVGLGTIGLWKYAARYSVMIIPGQNLELSNTSIALSAIIWLIPIVGVLALFFASALMPAIFGHLARGRQLNMLPYGRVRLLTSALCTVCLVAAIFGLVTKALFLAFPEPPEFVFAKGFAIALLTFSPMYLLVWFIGRAKGAIGSLSGAMLIIPSLALPFHFIQIPQPPMGFPITVGALIGLVSAIVFLAAPRWRHWRLFARVRPERMSRPASPRYSPGNEFALITGTARPWVLSIGLIVPVAVATLFITAPSIWLCYFMLCSVISGGISSLSVSRSRALWLRGPWTRSKLLSEIEGIHWRQNAYCLSSLIALLVAIGSYLDFPTVLLAVGIPLLLLGCATGTYLGLMMTRGIGWLDGTCAAGTMVVLLVVALRATDLSFPVIACAYAGLLCLALTYRVLAQKRWARLDWIECHPPVRRGAQAM